MCKTFFVAPGHEAVNRGVWHRAGLLLAVEEGETVDVYATNGNKPKICLGTYLYAQLDAGAPPIGLVRDSRGDLSLSHWTVAGAATGTG
jgi:hypothetical protein